MLDLDQDCGKDFSQMEKTMLYKPQSLYPHLFHQVALTQ